MVPRPVSPYAREPLIPQFYAGKSIFITGATGFMGKVLVERLLWTCPEIERIFLLMREKKEVSPEKRLAQLKQSQVFDVIREYCPGQLEKLYLIPGDTTAPNLGLSVESIGLLKEVSVVFHSAATLKFDEALNKAVDQNVRSVLSLMDICDGMPNIEALVHVSTAYSNAELSTVEERVYAAPVPLQQLLALADALPDQLAADLTPRLISPKPNTYTFTKALAENAVAERTNRKYPVAIFRPTIVISALRHPFPGWIENLNGPSGVLVAAGKGLLHFFCCKRSAKADMIPVDIAIDTLIAAAWETAVDKLDEVRVYNCSSGRNSTTWAQFEMAIKKLLIEHPLDKTYWYPSGAAVENEYLLNILQLITQTIPLHLAEYCSRMIGIKSRLSLITISERLQGMCKVLTFFSMREWDFKSDNVRKLQARLSPQDALIYNLDPNTIDWDALYVDFVKGTRKYLLKEKDQDIDEAKRHLRKMFYVHNGFLVFVTALLLRLSLHAPLVRSLVLGTLRLLFTIVSSTYSRVSS
ncbi:putative fatty acyl-CoA reductase CG5065 [Bombyx mandarina]|uniref:Fatty acyl-CoA reductase n=1 Tax=Bombyx mandarina TaxID=7092 RepID=A0A6J2JFA2_BOMMA|nr:putative fatty acyl-CoA reductase CG5065 [Bombyx mandarina]